ncbi:MAG: hypothetical protein LKJ83_06750 [Eubacteriaceae bacterium]|nr:hypothetical protein [Eubacteriaceae bacterium]
MRSSNRLRERDMQNIYTSRNKAAAVILSVMMVFTCFVFVPAGNANAASKKAPYKSGQSIKNAVFYIAVDVNNDGKITYSKDKVYYYTLAQLKAYKNTVSYHYGNHGEGETISVKGAKLSSMLKRLSGVKIKSSWIIQYAEEDAFHATTDSYKDTVAGLTDANGNGNGSGAGIAAETIIGYQGKMTYDTPDANNVNDTKYNNFTTYVEPSLLRAYRQTNSANSSVLKNFMGVVISKSGTTLTGKSGYTEQFYSDKNTSEKINEDKEVAGIPAGMKWAARPSKYTMEYAKVSKTKNTKKRNHWNGTSTVVTGSADYAKKTVKFYWTENNFFNTVVNGKTTKYVRSDLSKNSVTIPTQPTASPNKYWGYDKPMYIRYNGKWLKDIVTAGTGESVYIVNKDGTKTDITSTIGNYFVAFSQTQSKRSTNIADYNRKTVNYTYSELIDTSTAKVEASDGDADYTAVSGKTPTVITNVKSITVTKTAD